MISILGKPQKSPKPFRLEHSGGGEFFLRDKKLLSEALVVEELLRAFSSCAFIVADMSTYLQNSDSWRVSIQKFSLVCCLPNHPVRTRVGLEMQPDQALYPPHRIEVHFFHDYRIRRLTIPHLSVSILCHIAELSQSGIFPDQVTKLSVQCHGRRSSTSTLLFETRKRQETFPACFEMLSLSSSIFAVMNRDTASRWLSGLMACRI